jgi:hypothetical protein
MELATSLMTQFEQKRDPRDDRLQSLDDLVLFPEVHPVVFPRI